MAKCVPGRLPVWMTLLLVVCLCSLATHFYFESLSVTRAHAALFPGDDAGHADDQFLPGAQDLLSVNPLRVEQACREALLHTAAHPAPLLPPPNS